MQGYLAPMTAPDGAAACAALNHAGVTGWRLPTQLELYGLFDFGKNPVIDPLFTIPSAATMSPSFYSSTIPSGWTCGAAMQFNASAGFSRNQPDTGGACSPMWQYFIRCVRGRAWTPDVAGRFVTDVRDGQNVVTDTLTGLEWQGGAGKPVADWATALAYCEGLVFGGSTDWRLADAVELQSVVGKNVELGGSSAPGPQPEWISSTAYRSDHFLAVRSFDGMYYDLLVTQSFVGGPSLLMGPMARCVRLGR
jgi:hypothetical protein